MLLFEGLTPNNAENPLSVVTYTLVVIGGLMERGAYYEIWLPKGGLIKERGGGGGLTELFTVR